MSADTEEEVEEKGLLGWLIYPDDSISYTSLAVLYSVMMVVCGVCYWSEYEYPGSAPGWWIITAPCVPCWLWSVVMAWRAGEDVWPVLSAFCPCFCCGGRGKEKEE